MVDLKYGGLRLESEQVEAFEARKCCCCLRVAHSGREPAHSQELDRKGEGRLAIAEVQTNCMESVGIDDEEVVTECHFGGWASCTNRVAKLNA